MPLVIPNFSKFWFKRWAKALTFLEQPKVKPNVFQSIPNLKDILNLIKFESTWKFLYRKIYKVSMLKTLSGLQAFFELQEQVSKEVTWW